MTDDEEIPNTFFNRALADDEAGGRWTKPQPFVVGSGVAPVLPLAPHDSGPQPGIEPPLGPLEPSDLRSPVLGESLGGAGGYADGAALDEDEQELGTVIMNDAEWLWIMKRFYRKTWLAGPQARVDPLPPNEVGAPFLFILPKLSGFGDDFLAINAAVPRPNAQVDMPVAWGEALADADAISAIFASGRSLSFEQAALIFVNDLCWNQFWAVRHFDPEMRECFKQLVIRTDATATRLRSYLRRADHTDALDPDSLMGSFIGLQQHDEAERRIADRRDRIHIVKGDCK